MPLVSVVIAARDASRFIGDAVASIRAQTLRDWEMIVVDDASRDDTTDAVEAAAGGDRRIEVFRLDESRGSYGAANYGVLRATGRFIARLDADDVAESGRLEAQVAALRASGARACAGAWRAMSEDGVPEGQVRCAPSGSNRVLCYSLFLRSGLVHSTLMIETSAFEELGGYGPLRVAEDYRLWSRLARRDWLVTVDDPVVRWRRHSSQMTAVRARQDRDRHRVHAEHMTEMSGEPWSLDEARDIWATGERVGYGIRRADELLTRWEGAWARDFSLSTAEARGLMGLSARVRLAHLKHNFAWRPLSEPLAAPALASGALTGPTTRLVRSFLHPRKDHGGRSR